MWELCLSLDGFENDDLEDFDGGFGDRYKFEEEEEEGVDIVCNIFIYNFSYFEVKVYNLIEVVLLKICYLVVDKFIELVIRLLIVFGELG